ncbi:GNAT family N-acetyltransferase [Desulfospira joergensenii]|uniref:GNAT family N-acetyltransferase n=1 Tax=Desulfospira joergensenii TaxID=53329 RepID=UPI000686DAF7|nr:GNAT family N-acetyltransferase [Desulfospira joergensenii]
MTPTLKTARLRLRPLTIADQNAMVDTIMSDPDVMTWLPYSAGTSTPEGQKEIALGYLTDFINPWKEIGLGVWAVCIGDKELGKPGEFIGYCGFIPEQIRGGGPEIAYALGRSMWGKGIITEALTACLDWLFGREEIIRAYAVTDHSNTASRRVLEKIGMEHEKDVDLYDSKAKGSGLLPFYSIEREVYFRKSQKEFSP